MTIQVPDVHLRLQEQSSHSWPISDSEDFLLLRKKALTDAEKLDDDCCTLSTTSLSDTDSVEDSCVRVSFADELVTDVWTRPMTEPEEVPELFYSSAEIERFRQEYRMERKLLSSFDEGDSDLSSLIQPRSRLISRVVVLHNDKLETYDSGSDCTNDFFDTPEFWSGSITWW